MIYSKLHTIKPNSLLIVLSLAFVLVGCGGGTENPPANEPPPQDSPTPQPTPPPTPPETDPQPDPVPPPPAPPTPPAPPPPPPGGGSANFDCSLSTTHCVDDTAGANQEYSTIQSAVDVAQAGHTVAVFDGTYDGFRVSSSGTSTNRIHIVAAGQNANITGTEPFSGESIYIENASYVTVEGFIVSRNGRSGYGIGAHRASPTNPMRGLIIRNNTVSNSGSTNIYLSQVADSLIEGNVTFGSLASHGIYLSNGGSDNTTLRGNVCYNNNRNGIHFNGDISVGGDGLHTGLMIEGNIIYNNVANGLDMDGVQNSTIRNNVIYGNGRHAVRGFDIDSSAGPANLVIVNNTLVVPNDGNAYGIKLSEDSGGHIIFNNVFTYLSISVANSNFQSNYNILGTGLSINGSSYTLTDWRNNGYGMNSSAATPATVFASDFTLLANSPAHNTGTASFAGVNAPQTDINGNSRPNESIIDMGAHEY